MSFFHRLIFGAPTSPPTSSQGGLHSSHSTLESLQLTNTLHVLNFVEAEAITSLVHEIVSLARTRDQYALRSCEDYLRLLLNQKPASERSAERPPERPVSSENNQLFNMKVGLKVLQVETLEACFELVKNVLTKGKGGHAAKPQDNSRALENSDKPSCPTHFLDAVVEENLALRSKIHCLHEENRNRAAEEKQAESKFIKEVHVVVDAEVSRIRSAFKLLADKSQTTLADSEKLKTKIRNQEKLLSYLTEESDEKKRSLLLDMQKINTDKEHLQTKLKSAEKVNEELEKNLQTLSDNLQEQISLGVGHERDYNEKLAAFLKNTEEFKQGIQERNEARARRLEDENEKLSQENQQFRFKILDMDLKEIFRPKPATASKKRGSQL